MEIKCNLILNNLLKIEHPYISYSIFFVLLSFWEPRGLLGSSSLQCFSCRKTNKARQKNLYVHLTDSKFNSLWWLRGVNHWIHKLLSDVQHVALGGREAAWRHVVLAGKPGNRLLLAQPLLSLVFVPLDVLHRTSIVCSAEWGHFDECHYHIETSAYTERNGVYNIL